MDVTLDNMARAQQYRNRIELLQGTLDLPIMQMLQWGPRHGYGIAHAIRVNSSHVLQVDTVVGTPRCIVWSGKKPVAASWMFSQQAADPGLPLDAEGPRPADVPSIAMGAIRRCRRRNSQRPAAGMRSS